MRDSQYQKANDKRSHAFLRLVARFLLALTLAVSVLCAQPAIGPLLNSDLTLSTAGSSSSSAKIAFDGLRYLVVWSQYTDLSSLYLDVYGQFISTAGVPAGGPFLIASAAGNQDNPSVAFNGSYYLVIWHDNGSSDSVRGRSVSTAGVVSATQVVLSPGTCTNSEIAVASDNVNFLAVWNEGCSYSTQAYNVLGQFVAVNGSGVPSLLGSNVVIANTPQVEFFPSVAFGLSQYLVTWTNDPSSNAFQFDVYGKLVSTYPPVLSAAIPISTAPGLQSNRTAGVAFGGGSFLVAFDDQRNAAADIYGVRVTEAGTVLDPAGIPIAVSVPGCSPHHPKVAFGGGEWLVAIGCSSTRGVRVATSGTVVDTILNPFFLSTTPQKLNPEIAFDGANFLVTDVELSGTWRKFAQLAGLLSADLSLTKSDSPDPVSVNSNLTYTIVVSNQGPTLATGVVVSDPLPTGATFISATSTNGSCSQSAGTVTCNIGTMLSATTATVTIVIRPTAPGTITNTATVSSPAADPNPSNNSATASTTVSGGADLSLSMSDSPDPVAAGANLTYSILVNNAGPAAATSVSLTDTLPAGVTLVSAAPSQGTCSGTTTINCALGTLPNGGSATVLIVVTVGGVGTLSNTASVSATELDSVPSNNSATASTTVVKASQTITFGPLANKTFGDPPFAVSATASSGLVVTFSTVGSCTVSGSTVTLTGAGSCAVTASQAGNANYDPAPDVTRSFTIAKAGQTITFGPLANKTFGDLPFAVSATASSGLAVTFSAVGSCTVSGSTVTLTGAGSCAVTASQAGNTNYDPAPDVTRSFTIAKASQTITFGPLANKTFGDPPFAVSATASSGLAVTFSASGTCTVAGATVTLTAAGSCTISANQTGNANYDPAPTVARTFTIAVPVPTDTTGPSATSLVASPNPAASGTPIALAATVDDTLTGNSNIVAAEYNLDNGAYQPMTASDAAFNSPVEAVSASLVFAVAGVHEVCVRGRDSGNNIGQPVCILLAVYDPGAGFVTGGGWINSPAGAYTANPSLTGKANFGFVSRYQKGANTPSGNTQFQFKAAGLDFSSTSYEWLVIAGARAQFKGTGTINGSGSYSFLLTAIDSDRPGGGTVDRFRIKITGPGGIVYDNQSGKPDTGSDGTELGGGSIVIHP